MNKDLRIPRDWEDSDVLKDPLIRMDFSSETFAGATNGAAALGNGKLTVGISPWGEIIYFRWPTPSYYDQLRYLTRAKGLFGVFFPQNMRYGKDAPGIDWQRYGRPYEEYPGLGARGGLFYKNGNIRWFGDPSWKSNRHYEPEFGPILCTELSNNSQVNLEKNETISICQLVDFQNDLLIQKFTIRSNTIEAEKFFYYATFAPTYELDPYMGVPDSGKRGYAAIYLQDLGGILYFIPKLIAKKREKLLNELILEDSAKNIEEKIDELYPEGGIYILLSFFEKPDNFHIGADKRRKYSSIKRDTPIGADDTAKIGEFPDPQIKKKDKKNNKRFGLIGPINAGLERDLSKIPGAEKNIFVLTSIADTAVEASEIIKEARNSSIEQIEKNTTELWLKRAQKIKISSEASETEKKVAERSILNLFIARDKENGGIIASPSRQPAYHFDWPRDGAFYDLALDLAGFNGIVGDHLDFYKRSQRKNKFAFSPTWLLGFKSPFYNPRGHWHANLYTNGNKGGLSIIPLEIDETSLILWDIWRHEQFVPERDRDTYSQSFKETLILAADAVVSNVSIKKKWLKKTIEDDNQIPNATLHGAAAVLTGLASAADAGKKWGLKTEKVETWYNSATILREGILNRIKDEKFYEQAGWRGIQWSLFPAPVFEDFDDSSVEPLVNKLIKEVEMKTYRKKLGYAYFAEQLFILSFVCAKRDNTRKLLNDALHEITSVIPIHGSKCFGEITLWVGISDENDLIPQQRTSIPHLWTGICSYLAVEAYYHPERFYSQIPPIPK